MADTAADVPAKYDCLINGHGYTFARNLDGSYLSGTRHHAEYDFTATFVERTNVGQGYGDDQQDFFLTVSQDDWSGGQNQRFLHVDDPNTRSRYFLGTSIDTSVEGQFQSQPAGTTSSFTTAAAQAMCPQGYTLGAGLHAFCASTHLYSVSAAGAVSDIGTHGAGTVNRWGMCNDGVNVYIAGSSKLRKWTGSGFTDFGSNANSGSLAYSNNVLYSCDGSSLYRYSTSGTKSAAIFTWQDATGTPLPALGQTPKLVPFGGVLLIFWPNLGGKPALWTYDGTSTYQIAALPLGCTGYDCAVVNGIVYLSATLSLFGAKLTPAVYYYTGGQVGEVWQSKTGLYGGSGPALGSYNGNLVFTDNSPFFGQAAPNSVRLVMYDASTGAMTEVAKIEPAGSLASLTMMLSSSTTTVWYGTESLTSYLFFPDTAAATTGAVMIASLIDFGNSLTKIFRGVKIDFTGNGIVAINYQVDGLSAATGWSVLATSITSGTEYLFPANTAGHAVSIEISVSDNADLSKTIVKRMYLRASPILQSFGVNTYNLDLSGDGLSQATILQDGSPQPLSGHEQAVNVRAAIKATAPFSVTDRFGTYTGICEPAQCSVLEIHSNGGDASRSGSFVAQIVVREV